MSNRKYGADYEPRPLEQAADEQNRYRLFLGRLHQAGLSPPDAAERAALAVLAALEDRLTAAEAEDLRQELPWTLRDRLRDKVRPGHVPPERVGRDGFVARVADELGVDDASASATIEAVFAATRALLSEKEAADVGDQLPGDMKGMWAR